MSIRPLVPQIAVCLFLSIAATYAADSVTRFDAKAGASKVRIEGTSSVHDWQIESTLVGGHLDADPGFPIDPGQTVTTGKMDARVEAIIPVRALKSIEKNGTHYSDRMDEVVWEHLSQTNHPRILYYLSELTLKEPPKEKDAPYTFDAKGDLVVGGVTNHISMPIFVTPLGGRKIKIAGTTTVKMSDFHIQAPTLSVMGIGLIKTADEAKLFFEWVVAQKQPAPAAN
jgi:hypothetical protein